MRPAVDLEGVHETVLDRESRTALEMASEGVLPSGDDEVPRETAPPFRAERAGLGDLATIPISISREDFAHVEFEHLVRQGPAANDRNPVADAQGCTPYRDNSTTPACDERVVGGRNDFAPGSSPEPQQRGAESVPADRADPPPDDSAFLRKTRNFQEDPGGQVAPFRRPFVADCSVRHEPIHEFANREDGDPARLPDEDLGLEGETHLRARLTDRLCRHDPRRLVRVDRVEIELLADFREDLVKALLAQLESMDLLRELADDVPRQPAADLLQALHDLLFARRQRGCLHRDGERCFRLRFRGLRGGLPPARGRLRFFLLRSLLHLDRSRAEFLEDLLGLFLREELRESLDLRGRQFFKRETRVREDDRGLLREAAVAQRLDRRGPGHPHSSDGGSSSSTSTSSSEISTYMSFSVRP